MLKRNTKVEAKKEKKGQSTIEYILLVAAVLAALIFFLRPGGPFSTKVNDTWNIATSSMVNIAGALGQSHGN